MQASAASSATPVASSTSVVTASTAETKRDTSATAIESLALRPQLLQQGRDVLAGASNDTVAVLHTNVFMVVWLKMIAGVVVRYLLLSGIVNDSRSKGTTTCSGDSVFQSQAALG